MKLLHNNTAHSSRQLQHYLIKVLIVLIVLSILIGFAPLFNTPSAYRFASILTSLVVISTFSWMAIKLVMKLPHLLLTPLPVTFGFIVLIFGLGPLIHFFGPEAALAEIRWRWSMVAQDVFRVQVANSIGLTFVTLGMLWGIKLHPLKSDVRFVGLDSLSNKQIMVGAWSFLLLALCLRSTYLFLNVNLLKELPAFMGPMGKVGWITILVSSFLSGRKVAPAWVPMLVSLSIEIIYGALTLDRFDILMPLVLASIGFYLGGGRIKILLISIVFIAVIYVIIRPIVDVGRHQVWTTQSMTASQYWLTTVDEKTNSEKISSSHRESGWWHRLNYTPYQSVLMDKYDNGQSGETYKNILWIFIPRFIAPDKPILDVERQMNIMIFGHGNSATAATIFGESYWNGGWALLIISGFLYGMIIWFVTVACLSLFSQPNIFGWPIAIYGMLMGKLILDFFTVGVIGHTVIFFALVGLIKFFSRRTLRTHRVATV